MAIFIALLAIMVKVFGVSPIVVAIALPIGYLAILVDSVMRFARTPNSKHRIV